MHLSKELQTFLRPGMGDGVTWQTAAAAAAAAAKSNSDTATVLANVGSMCGWLRVSRQLDWPDEFAECGKPQRRWCTLRTSHPDCGANADSDGSYPSGAWLSYSRRPGAGQGGIPLRSIHLDTAVLSPALLLTQQRSFELCSAHERVLFVADSVAERTHWLSVLCPLLMPTPQASPINSTMDASRDENNELQLQRLHMLNKRELRQRAELAGADAEVISHAMDEEDPRPVLLQLIEFEQFWHIGGQRLGWGSHVGPHYVSRPSTIPDYTRRRSKSFSCLSTAQFLPAHWPSKVNDEFGVASPTVQTVNAMATDVKELPLLRLALKNYQAGVRLFPDDAARWCDLAEAKASLGDWNAAKSDFIRALSIAPMQLSTTLAYERVYARAHANQMRQRSAQDTGHKLGPNRRRSECALIRRSTGSPNCIITRPSFPLVAHCEHEWRLMGIEASRLSNKCAGMLFQVTALSRWRMVVAVAWHTLQMSTAIEHRSVDLQRYLHHRQYVSVLFHLL